MAAKAVAKPAQQRPARIVRQELAPAAAGPLRFTSVSDEPEEREALFYIDDVEYTIPVHPSMTIGNEALHLLAEHGGGPLAQVIADDYVMTKMLGEEGYAALRACSTIKPHELQQLKEIISKKALGALEDGGPNR